MDKEELKVGCSRCCRSVLCIGHTKNHEKNVQKSTIIRQKCWSHRTKTRGDLDQKCAEVAKDINEVFLLHGTKPPSAGASCGHEFTTIWKQVKKGSKKRQVIFGFNSQLFNVVDGYLVLAQYEVGHLRGRSPCLDVWTAPR